MLTRGTAPYKLAISVVGDLDALAEYKLADSNGVIATYTRDDTNTSANVSFTLTDKDGSELASFGKDSTGNSWEVQYSDGSSETLY